MHRTLIHVKLRLPSKDSNPFFFLKSGNLKILENKLETLNLSTYANLVVSSRSQKNDRNKARNPNFKWKYYLHAYVIHVERK